MANILGQYHQHYIKKMGTKVLPSHRRAIGDILACRTPVMGGSVYECTHCNNQLYSYHSCKTRHCPKCGKSETTSWVASKKQQLPDTHYFHIVFTLDAKLRGFIYCNQRKMYHVLFAAASQTLKQVAKENGFGATTIGMLGILHTWTRAMVFHPHIHLLVPGGGYDKNTEKWLCAKKKYFVPERALSKVFRALIWKFTMKQFPDFDFPQSVWKKDWVIRVKPVLENRGMVIEYLARYVKRIAITNNRILRVHNDVVTFKYQDNKTRQWHLMNLPVFDFISRFLQHTLPSGFVKIRSYGLLSPAYKKYLPKIKEHLEKNKKVDNEEEKQKSDSNSTLKKPEKPRICDKCKNGTFILIEVLPQKKRAPP